MEIGGQSNQLLVKLMSATSLRDRTISANIANQSVPGYKRRDVKFEELLHERIDRGDPDLLSVQPEITVDTKTPGGEDGNNVSLETETAHAKENRLMFELYAAIYQSRMELVQAAITK